ncbi:MAG: helix-hairpin-helix domain-containing protein [Clostridia bacterium]|nr:helix-hairpin-helix domain-containing protein [Clostridia bacterium]
MKTFGVVLVWVMAAVLMIAVCLTAVADELALRPLTVESVSQREDSTGTVNLNTATAEELCEIDGLGEVTAERIIQYREVHGSFRSVEDLLDVEGIGEKRLAQWRQYFTTESPQG